MQVPLNSTMVDVSKAELVIATYGQDDCLSVPNECTAILQCGCAPWLPARSWPWSPPADTTQLLANLAAGANGPSVNAATCTSTPRVWAHAARPTGPMPGSLRATWPSTRPAAPLPRPQRLPGRTEQLLGQRGRSATKRIACASRCRPPARASLRRPPRSSMPPCRLAAHHRWAHHRADQGRSPGTAHAPCKASSAWGPNPAPARQLARPSAIRQL